MKMRTIGAAIIMFVLLTSNVLATPNHEIMRDLTIETMLNYAKELYQRGDIKESKNVMARIKQLNPDYLQQPKQEQKITVITQVNPVISKRVEVKPIEIVAVAEDPNEDLRQAIAREDQVLSDLNHDVDALRTQIQATHHE